MFLRPFRKGLSAVILPESSHVLCWKPNRSALSSGDLKLLSSGFNFLTGHNYVLMYWIIFSSGCFTAYLNYTGFPCSCPLLDRGISLSEVGTADCCCRELQLSPSSGVGDSHGVGRCFLVSIREACIYKEVVAWVTNLTGCVAEHELKRFFFFSFLTLLHADYLEYETPPRRWGIQIFSGGTIEIAQTWIP